MTLKEACDKAQGNMTEEEMTETIRNLNKLANIIKYKGEGMNRVISSCKGCAFFRIHRQSISKKDVPADCNVCTKTENLRHIPDIGLIPAWCPLPSENSSGLVEEALEKAVNGFTVMMKNRLAEQEAKGYTGWNDEKKMATGRLVLQLKKDAEELASNLYPKENLQTLEQNMKDCIDIANRAMMIYHRLKG